MNIVYEFPVLNTNRKKLLGIFSLDIDRHCSVSYLNESNSVQFFVNIQ